MGLFLFDFLFLLLFILGKRVKKFKTKKKWLVMLRFLTSLAKLSMFFSGAGSALVGLFFRKKEVTFLTHTIARGRRGVRGRLGIFLTNSSRYVGLILLPSSNF